MFQVWNPDSHSAIGIYQIIVFIGAVACVFRISKSRNLKWRLAWLGTLHWVLLQLLVPFTLVHYRDHLSLVLVGMAIVLILAINTLALLEKSGAHNTRQPSHQETPG